MTRKTSTKAKAAALEVPQSIDEANDLVAEYGDLFNQAAHLEADMNIELASAKAKFEEQAKPVSERMELIFTALNAFAGANRKQLTNDGKTKTVRLPAGEIGWRLNPPSVKWARGYKGETIVANIKALLAKLIAAKDYSREAVEQRDTVRRFIRTKEEPNKETMGDHPDVARMVEGVRVGSSGEQFFVAPFGAELSEPKS